MANLCGVVIVCAVSVCGAVQQGRVLPVDVSGRSDTWQATAAQFNTAPVTVPISVLSEQVDPTRRVVTFVLQNTGTKVITAWDVRFVVGTEPDAKYGGIGVDAFREFAGLVGGQASLIMPGGTIIRTAPLPPGSEQPATVVITPTAAVFADASFAGDEKFAQLIFDNRTAQLQSWQDIVRKLERTRDGGHVDLNELELLLSDLDSQPSRNGDIVRRTFRANVSIAVANVRAGRGQARATLIQLLDDARHNVAVANAHRQQR